VRAVIITMSARLRISSVRLLRKRGRLNLSMGLRGALWVVFGSLPRMKTNAVIRAAIEPTT